MVGGALKVREDVQGAPENFHILNGDEMVNDQALDEQMQIAQLCNLGNCNQIPETNLMKIKVKALLSY